MTYDNLLLAWVAGFFDGEGSISVSHKYEPYVRTNGRHSYCLRISITNTYLATLEYVEMMFSGTIHQSDKGKNKPCYQWRLLGRDKQKAFIQAILPYLRVRKSQAELALKFLDTVFDIGIGQKRLPDDFLLLRQNIRFQLKKENKG